LVPDDGVAQTTSKKDGTKGQGAKTMGQNADNGKNGVDPNDEEFLGMKLSLDDFRMLCYPDMTAEQAEIISKDQH